MKSKKSGKEKQPTANPSQVEPFKNSDLEDLRILENIKKGNGNAFIGIIKKYREHIYYKYVRAIGSVYADDLLQDLFIKVFAKLENYSPEHSFNTWFSVVAHNHLLDFIRQKKMLNNRLCIISLDEMIQTSNNREDTVGDIFDGEIAQLQETIASPDENLEKELDILHRSNDLYACIKDMQTMDKQVLQLFYVERKKYIEIAELLNVSINVVKVRLLRAKKKLKKLKGLLPKKQRRNQKLSQPKKQASEPNIRAGSWGELVIL